MINTIRSRKLLVWGDIRGKEEDDDSDHNEHNKDDYNDAGDDDIGSGS